VFQVRQQGKVIGSFIYFVDAWLYIYLECRSFATILESNTSNVWRVNPSHPTN
jgi:hypothetical protein